MGGLKYFTVKFMIVFPMLGSPGAARRVDWPPNAA